MDGGLRLEAELAAARLKHEAMGLLDDGLAPHATRTPLAQHAGVCCMGVAEPLSLSIASHAGAAAAGLPGVADGARTAGA